MPKKPLEEAEEVDEAEAKRQRKAARKAAKEAAAAAEEEVDEEEAKRQRKAAKKAAKEAAAATAAEEEEVDEEEAKRQRKAAKKAAKQAAARATAKDDGEEAPKKAKKEKRAAAELEEAEEAPKAKKSKLVTEAADEAAVEETSFRVFVKGLDHTVDEASLRKHFAECGAITKLQLPMDSSSGTPKGFAFISFSSQEGFNAALKYDNTDFSGRFINVSEAKVDGKGKDGKGKDGKGKDGKGGKEGNGKSTKGTGKAGDWNCPKCGDLVFGRNNSCRQCGAERPGGPVAPSHDHENTVFLRGLPWAATEDTLRKDFADCGDIVSVRMPQNAEGRPSGIAYIKFSKPEAVDAALKFDETPYGGRTLNVCKSGDTSASKGKGKGKGKDSKGKDGKGKDGKGKGKGKGKAPSESRAKSSGCIVASTAAAKTFEDSDDE